MWIGRAPASRGRAALSTSSARAGGDTRRVGVASCTDAVVVGSGFGGLGASLALAEGGARVVLLEALTYPGGCASTFRRGGLRFEAGATLCAGFDPGQLFRRWIDRHGLDVPTERMDPVVELRTPAVRLAVPPDRSRFVAGLAALPGAPAEGVRAFFAEQERVAALLWRLLDDPDLLPPLRATTLVRHVIRAPAYAPIARVAGRPVLDVLRRHGVDGFAPLRAFVESFAQITVQCGASEAEAPVALATADYAFRGAAHVRGGIGTLATALAGAVRARGGDVRFATRARGIERRGGVWRVTTNRGAFEAPVVVANVLPQALRPLAGIVGDRELDRRADAVAGGWGAAMLYLFVRAPRGAPPSAIHLDLSEDPSAPYDEGNHVFASVSAEGDPVADDPGAGAGFRAMTVSTHVRAAELAGLPDAARALRVRTVQERMRRVIDRLAPEWTEHVARVMTASPRTFERFTSRPGGLVGGVPRRAGLANYRDLTPYEVRRGLWLVGDSVFPGQSTLAAAIGGTRVAAAILRSGRIPRGGAA